MCAVDSLCHNGAFKRLIVDVCMCSEAELSTENPGICTCRALIAIKAFVLYHILTSVFCGNHLVCNKIVIMGT